MTDEIEADGDTEVSALSEVPEPDLRLVVAQQEVVIGVLRERLAEVEQDLINARCDLAFHAHSH